MLQLWFFANTLLMAFSVRLGGLALNLNVAVLGVAGVVWAAKNRKISFDSVKVMLALLAFAMWSLIVALSGPCKDNLVKSLLTLPILGFLVLIGLEVGRGASIEDWLRLQKTAKRVLAFAFATFLLEFLIPSLFPTPNVNYRRQGKLHGVFSEPSAAAFSLFPCIVILLVADNPRSRRIGYLSLLALLIVSRSPTLIA